MNSMALLLTDGKAIEFFDSCNILIKFADDIIFKI